MPRHSRNTWVAALAFVCLSAGAHAAERVTLKNGFDLTCDHRAADGTKVRLYLDATGDNYMEVNASDIASVQTVALPAPAAKPRTPVPASVPDRKSVV